MYATVTLAKLLYRTGRISEAKKYFHTVNYELPEYPAIYFELGKIASDQKKGGVSSFYLGKYYLYLGRLKQAEHHLKSALRSKTLPENLKAEIQELFKQIKRLRG
jgi:predicted Zn-dependent protease